MENEIYAGIGSRITPIEILGLMADLGKSLANQGCVLRSGGALGADSAFEAGCSEVKGKKEIFLPWNGYNNNKSKLNKPSAEAHAISRKYHPAWDKCSQGVHKLHARNAHIILGEDCNTPVSMVICYTENGSGKGGTGQAMRIAKDRGIEICDLGNPKDLEVVKKMLAEEKY